MLTFFFFSKEHCLIIDKPLLYLYNIRGFNIYKEV